MNLFDFRSNLLVQPEVWDETFTEEELVDQQDKKADPHAPSSLLLQQKKGFLYAKTPCPLVELSEEQGAGKVERLPIRYESLLDILDELPEQLRETIAQVWDKKKME